MAVAQSNPTRDKTSFLYLTGLGLVTLMMLVLPVLYLALTAAACYGVYYFATHEFLAIWDWPIGNSKWALLVKTVCSVTPLLVGGVIAVFMVKPIFARRGRRMQPLALTAESEPQVYQLVHDVCAAVGAPTPRRIDLSCDLNASAGFKNGVWSFLGNDLVLTLGMPLVAVLTQRELAGVIAHEFGHFRQSTAMRMSYLIRRVNGWFARVIYERDAWDETLDDAAHAEDVWVGIMVGCARFGVWLSRRILWVLMMLGHCVCSVLLREMEFDADRCEARIAGSDAFASTMLKLPVYGSVLAEIHRDMQKMWRKQFQLPDNLPGFFQYRATHISEEKREKIEQAALAEKTGWLDTHPSAGARITRAKALGEAGYDLSDEPAAGLFENYLGLSRLVTMAHYEDDLDVPVTPEFLMATEVIIGGKPAAAKVETPPASPLPMMSYQPESFRGTNASGDGGNLEGKR